MNRRSFMQTVGTGAAAAVIPAQPTLPAVETAVARIVAPDQGLVWVMDSDRPMTFKLLTEQTGDRLGVFEERVPPAAGTPLHIHLGSDEVIHVLEGELLIRLGTERSMAAAGSWVFIPRGVVHGWKNIGRTPARATYLFTPGQGAKFFEALRLLALPIPRIDQETLAALSKRHGYELVSLTWD